MGRRGDHSFDELSNMIIDAAYNQIEKNGVANVSTRKIASEIGYTVGTLYNIFKNINDIFVHINSRSLDRLKILLEEALNKPKSKNLVECLAMAYLKFSVESFNLWSMLFEYRFPEDHNTPKWYGDKINEVYMYLFQALKTQYPKTADVELKESMLVIWAGIHGICALHLKGKLDKVGAKSAEVLINNFITNYLKSLA